MRNDIIEDPEHALEPINFLFNIILFKKIRINCFYKI